MSALDSDWFAPAVAIEARVVALDIGIRDVALVDELDIEQLGALKHPALGISYGGWALVGIQGNGVLDLDQYWSLVLAVDRTSVRGDGARARSQAGPLYAALLAGLLDPDWKPGVGIGKLQPRNGAPLPDIAGFMRLPLRFSTRVTFGG